MTYEEIKQEANELSIDELRELADFCNTLADSLALDEEIACRRGKENE